MNLLRSVGWLGAVVFVGAVSVVGCEKTESLGTGEDAQNGGDGGGAGGSDGSGGRVGSGGAGGHSPGSGGSEGCFENEAKVFTAFQDAHSSCTANADCAVIGYCGPAPFRSVRADSADEAFALLEKSECLREWDGPTYDAECVAGRCTLVPDGHYCGEAIGSGGTTGTGGSGSGGANTCDRACSPVPPFCNQGEALTATEDNCCVRCVKLADLPPAACIIGGVRYEHLEVVKRVQGNSCLCVDGHVGRCTGVIRDGDAGTDLPLPTCPDGQDLVESCAQCGAVDYCKAWRFECRDIGTCVGNDAGLCGAEEVCYKRACVSRAQLCQ